MKALKVLLLAVITASFLVTAWLWFKLLSPWGYTPPHTVTAIRTEVPHRVFVYGTLRFCLVRRMVIGRDVAVETAILPGYRRDGLHVEPSTDDVVRGDVFVVDASELRQLDRYERLGVRYERIEKSLQDGSRAWVYQRIQGR